MIDKKGDRVPIYELHNYQYGEKIFLCKFDTKTDECQVSAKILWPGGGSSPPKTVQLVDSIMKSVSNQKQGRFCERISDGVHIKVTKVTFTKVTFLRTCNQSRIQNYRKHLRESSLQ